MQPSNGLCGLSGKIEGLLYLLSAASVTEVEVVQDILDMALNLVVMAEMVVAVVQVLEMAHQVSPTLVVGDQEENLVMALTVVTEHRVS